QPGAGVFGRARAGVGTPARALEPPRLHGRAARIRREAPAALEPGSQRADGRGMNPRFTPEEEAFRAEVVSFLADYRDLDAFFLQGHRWPQVRAFFTAMAERGWL